MHETLALILSLSLSGSLLAGLVWLIKPLLRNRIPRSVTYYLWVVVLIRLVIPWSWEGSIMNAVFAGVQAPDFTASQGEKLPAGGKEEATSSSVAWPSAEHARAAGVYDADPDHSAYLLTLVNEYVLYGWLAGVVISLAVHVTGYMRFAASMRNTSRPASDNEHALLNKLLQGRTRRVRLVRNAYAATPMLLGLFRPRIIIPDTAYTEGQLTYILQHELVHLRRWDIAVKWLTVIVTSLHWFNPLMMAVRKEINQACECSCDEAVVRGLTTSEKQAYGAVLLAVAARRPQAGGGLQATFAQEKAMLRERLVAIMRPHTHTKTTVLFSNTLLALVMMCALVLGASTAVTNPSQEEGYSRSHRLVEPPDIVIAHEGHTEPIGNYQVLKSSWNGAIYNRLSFYQTAWSSEPTLLTGLRRLKPGEGMSVDFGANPPDQVTVQMAYLTESHDESLLPIREVAVRKVKGKYMFANPPAAVSDIPTTGRVFSITAVWGENVCEYVFASDGKFDHLEP
ncbi:M56 family metallopeptidase [Paenibacillus filicis]|uniref:M56 family metallopeptidase n=1 Tax=Paenibacillus filicis TaxID=669464 RepID=A0ABU9DEV1_9BACL